MADISEQIRQLVKADKVDHLNKSRGQSRVWWKAINDICRTKTSNGNSYDGDVNEINKYYASITTDEDYVRSKPGADSSNTDDNIGEISPLSVYYCLRKVKKTASGPDDISWLVLKEFAAELAEPVTHIFNLSLETAVVSDIFKKANIVPVAKVPHACSPDQFRPISLTCVLSRILERLVVKRYLKHPISKLSGANQYGFKCKSNPELALLDMQRYLSISLDNPRCLGVRLFAIDFRKAFDKVKHSILFKRTDALDIPEKVPRWVKNFVTNGKHRVHVNGRYSLWLPVTKGVPQGSVTGPLLFLLYILDLAVKYPRNRLVKFADDCTLLVAIFKELQDVSAEEIENLKAWCQAHGMEMNLQKTKELFCSLRRRELPQPVSEIEQVKCVKLLGMQLQSNLRFDNHVEATKSTCVKHLYLMKQVKCLGASMTELQILFNAWIISRLTYCSTVYVNMTQKEKNHATECTKKGLQMGSNKC